MKQASQTPQVQYDLLIDRLIGDFRPARPLWQVGARLGMWLLLEIGIISSLITLRGYDELSVQLESIRYLLELGVFIFVGVAAANLALRTAIPGREATRGELTLISMAGLVGIGLILSQPVKTDALVGQFVWTGSTSLLSMVSLAAVPWIVLFWAVKRGVPLQPAMSGGLVGAAAFCFAFVALRLVSPVNDSLELLTWQVLPIGLATALSMFAGAIWLEPSGAWRDDLRLVNAPNVPRIAADIEAPSFRSRVSPRSLLLNGRAFERTLFPFALAAAVALLAVFLRDQWKIGAPVADFDLAIASYGRSLTNFEPNVPSDSLGILLKAYIEHGMPAYMWDFGPDGYQLVGGRFERRPDGTPLTYTLFRGHKGAIICMFRAIEGFNPPAGVYDERRHYFFYRYRGYSICLRNVGGYGRYVSVLVARMPMTEFMRTVLAVAP